MQPESGGGGRLRGQGAYVSTGRGSEPSCHCHAVTSSSLCATSMPASIQAGACKPHLIAEQTRGRIQEPPLDPVTCRGLAQKAGPAMTLRQDKSLDSDDGLDLEAVSGTSSFLVEEGHLRQPPPPVPRWLKEARQRLGGVQLPKSALALPRKHLIVAGVSILLLIAILLPPSRKGIATLASASKAAGKGGCSVARKNPKSVQAPLNPDVAALTSFWPDLRTALENGGKDLPTLQPLPWQDYPRTPQEIRDRDNDLSEEDATLVRELHRNFLNDIPPYPTKTFKGKGIVILAGGEYSEYAATALGVLRELGSTLPVEVWQRDEREEKLGFCSELEHEGMVCRRLSDYLDVDLLSIHGGVALKVFTIVFSSFEEVIFIDADNIPLQRPEVLFESTAYEDIGAILWHDFWKSDALSWTPYLLGMSEEQHTESIWNETSYESGQMVWSKERHWRSLLLAVYYNYYGEQFFYSLFNAGFAGWGDKDTYPLAFRALGGRFFTVEDEPADAWENGRVGDRRNGMLQFGPVQPGKGGDVEGKPQAVFLHATTAKWSFREFLCRGCLPIWPTDSPNDPFWSHYEDLTKDFHRQLKGFIRFLDEGVLEYMPDGLDIEVVLWRVLEYYTCRSKAWRHERTCAVSREYMMRAWNFTFVAQNDGRVWAENGTETVVPGWADGEVCLVDPVPKDAEVVDGEG